MFKIGILKYSKRDPLLMLSQKFRSGLNSKKQEEEENMRVRI